MNKISKDNKSKFIICHECEGSGVNKFGGDCMNCGGIGTGRFFHDRFLYWSPKFSKGLIEFDHFRKKFNKAVNILALTVMLIGLLAMAYWVFKVGEQLIEFSDFKFWRIQHPLLLLFWIGIISGLFVIYRISEDEASREKIKTINYEERNRPRNTPNNWSELKKAKKDFLREVSRGFSETALTTVENAFLLARELEHKYVSPLHLFFVSLEDEQVAALFSRLNVDSKTLINAVKSQLMKLEQDNQETKFSRALKEVLVESYIQAHELDQKHVTTKNFLIPSLEYNDILKEVLYDLDVDSSKIYNVILWFIINEKQIESYRQYRQKAQFKPATNMDRAYTSVSTPILDQFAYDLTIAAKWGKLEYCVAREAEIEKIFQAFEGGANSVLLVGSVGVGKNTIIDGIAQLMVKEDVPNMLKDKRLVELDATRLISGVNPSQAQGRMIAIIDEVIRAGNIILYINNIQNMIGITSGEEESLDLSEVLASALDRGELKCLASASGENYTKYIEGKSLGSIMTKIDIKEPIGNEAVQIIESKIGHFEGKYKVYFSYEAIEQVIKMSNRYIHDKYLPDKAIKILELVAVRVAKKKGEQSIVANEDVAEVVSDLTNVPVTKVSESEGKNLLNLENEIHKRMINQKEAVNMVAASLRRARTEMREGNRPIANFLFLGPTGVGKTELAKTVAEVYFGQEACMIRLDMSEYQHQDSINKMIGDANGAIGYLTEAVRKKPFALVLLDEIEKAHPDILNLFLQVMDDGRLTDGQGRTIDFTNSIIIATSNAGAKFIQEEIFKGTDINIVKEVLINKHLVEVMRPELINRFDGVIVFEPLSLENVVEIARLMIAKMGKMLENKGIFLNIEEEGLRLLAKNGYDPKFGARPLRRLVQDMVENKIANLILADELKRRDTVLIDANADVKVEKGRIL